jgi:hypothetical protein
MPFAAPELPWRLHRSAGTHRVACVGLIAGLVAAPGLWAQPSQDGVQPPVKTGSVTSTNSGTSGARSVGNAAGRGTDSGERTSGNSRSNNAVPAAVVGAVALVAIGSLLARERSGATTPSSQPTPSPDELTRRLLDEGPQMAPAFNMSAFAVRGFVRGGWPVLVDFEQRSPGGSAELRISARDLPEVYSYDLGLVCPPPRRCVVQFRLPPEVFGDQLRPAVFAALATNGTGRQTQPDFTVYALGAGPRAIGSVAIDQVSFGPSMIRVAEKQRALYRFYSHSDFGHAAVEFWKVQSDADGNRLAFIDDRAIDGGLRKDQWIGLAERREWDGTEKGTKVSTGMHKVQVRAWDRVGDWLTSWSDATVTVER